MPSVSGMSGITVCPLSPLADDPAPRNHLPPPLPLPVSSHLYASCCTAVLFKVLYCKVNSIFCLLVFYVLSEKYYKPIEVQYYIAGCVSWVPRLTDLRTNLNL